MCMSSRLAQTLRKFFVYQEDTFMENYVFNQIRSLWAKAHSASLGKANTHTSWEPVYEDFFTLFRRGKTIPVTISLLPAGMLALVNDINSRFDTLCLESQDIRDAVNATNISHIHDNPSNQRSFLRTKEANKLFAPLITQLWVKLKLKESRAVRLKWLEDQVSLSNMLMTGQALASGIPLRPFQMAGLLYAKLGDLSLRNTFVLDGHLCIAFPLKKNPMRKDKDERSFGIHVVPDALAMAFILNIAVFRPIRMLILQGRRKGKPYDTGFLTHLYTTPSGAPMTGSVINAIVKKHLSDYFELQADIFDLRQIMISIFHNHYPDLFFTSNSQGALYRQADHSAITDRNKYGIDAPSRYPNFSLSSSEIKDYVSISRLIQAIFGLVPLDSALASLRPNVPIFVMQERRWMALERARILAMTNYNLLRVQDVEAEVNIAAVEAVMDAAPYLAHSQKVRSFVHRNFCCSQSNRVTHLQDWNTLGDSVLTEVTALLLFGFTRPDTMDGRAKLEGYPLETVAHAPLLVSLRITFHS